MQAILSHLRSSFSMPLDFNRLGRNIANTARPYFETIRNISQNASSLSQKITPILFNEKTAKYLTAFSVIGVACSFYFIKSSIQLLKKLNDEAVLAKKSCAALQQEKAAADQEIVALNTKLKNAEEAQLNKQPSVVSSISDAALEKSYAELGVVKEQLETANNDLIQENSGLKKSNRSLTQQLQEMSHEQKGLKEEFTKVDSLATRLIKQVEDLNQAKKTADAQISQSTETAALLTSVNLELNQKINQLEEKFLKLEDQKNKAEVEVNQLKQQLQNILEHNKALKEAYTKADSLAKDLMTQVEELEEVNKEKDSKIKNLEFENQQTEAKCKHLNETIAFLNDELIKVTAEKKEALEQINSLTTTI